MAEVFRTPATASGGGATSDEATATVTATQSPALSLVKTATPAAYSTVGQVITYSYVIKNTGNVTLTGTFSVNDDKATVTVTQPADGALSPNETCSATATYTITQADLDGGSVKNTATASGGGATSDEATATVTATQSPALSLVKTATPATYSTVGQVITYSYVIKNTGNVTLTGTFSVNDDKATVTVTQPADGALSPNETCSATATYTITQADLDGGSVKNTATASGGGATSDEATATVTATQSPALSLVKTATPATYSTVGQVITYSYVIKNTGNVTLTGTFSVNDDKATVTVTQPADGALSPNETCSATATYTITQADLDGGSVKNTATASGGGATSDEATATVTATQSPALSLVKTATPATYSTVGQVITYSYVIKNTGNVTLTGTFSVNDDKATVTVTPPADGALSPMKHARLQPPTLSRRQILMAEVLRTRQPQVEAEQPRTRPPPQSRQLSLRHYRWLRRPHRPHTVQLGRLSPTVTLSRTLGM